MPATPHYTNMTDRDAFKAWTLANQQQGTTRGPRTTLSMNGSRQLNVTAQSLSDIMQGTMSVRGPEELDLVLNKALTNNLDFLYESDYKSISAFSTAKYEFAKGHWPGSDAVDNTDPITGGANTTGNPLGSSWVGDENTKLQGKEVAQIAYWVGFRDYFLEQLVAISKRESGGWRPMAKNPDTSDRGLWQINGVHTSGLEGANIIRPGKREIDLLDPVINGHAAWWLCGGRSNGATGNNQGSINHHWGADESGWVGASGDPLYNCDINEAKAAVATAKAEGLLGKPFYPVGTTTTDGTTGSTTPGNHTIAQIKKASAKVGAHPNNKLGASALSEAGQTPVSAGLPNAAISYPVYKEGGKAWLMPSLLNHLWFIFENGFQLGSNWGVIVAKYSGSGNGKPSNHAYGGAVDVGTVGLASDGRGYDAHTPAYRPIFDQMMNLLSTTPSTGWADEYGCHFGRVNYGSGGFHTYLDAGHFHLGFKPERSGTLISALL